MKFPQRSQLEPHILRLTDSVFTILIFLSIVALILYGTRTVWQMLVDVVDEANINIIHNVVYIVVLLKAYKILTSYLESHNLSINYLVQIAIIAPAIEVIFATSAQPLATNIMLAVFSIINLVIYLYFYQDLKSMDAQKVPPQKI